MTPNDMIARYAQDVARRLPKEMRADVQAELQALLTDSLRERAANAAPTNAMAADLLVSFGAPRDVALRYHTPPAIVEPVDARLFAQLAASFLGGLAIVTIGFALAAPSGTPDVAPQAQQKYLEAALQVLGLLVAIFWAIGALRRRNPQWSAWKPSALPRLIDPDHVDRLGMALTVLAGACGTLVLSNPAVMFNIIWSGHPAPALLHAFAYDGDFLLVRAPLLFSCLGLSLAVLAWVAIEGRWRKLTRRVELVLTLAICAVMAWSILAGPIFQAAPTDQLMKLCVAIIGGFALTNAWSDRDRRWGDTDHIDAHHHPLVPNDGA
ncbi:MAG: hypothetical protein WAU68_11465 [Vitreimonas sp.]